MGEMNMQGRCVAVTGARRKPVSDPKGLRMR